jgi:hypothetical protein
VEQAAIQETDQTTVQQVVCIEIQLDPDVSWPCHLSDVSWMTGRTR